MLPSRRLAGELVNSGAPRRWLLIKREAGIPDSDEAGNRWSVDHLHLDQDGIPTLVEVKRSTDTRIRREVVGQMLDYAANSVVYWSFEVMQQQFLQTCASPDAAEAKLAEFLEGAEPDEFWGKVKANLQAGKIRMLFVADHVPKELRRIVEFLNVQMDPAEVLALEIRQYVGQNLKTFVPSVIGQTSEAEMRKATSAGGRLWDEASFFNLLRQRDAKAEPYARKLLDWASTRGSVWWGRGAQTGSFVPMIRSSSKPQALCAMYTGGTLEMYFRFLASKPPFDDAQKLNDAVGRASRALPKPLIEDAAHKKPNIRLSELSVLQFDQLLEALDWMAQAIHNS